MILAKRRIFVIEDDMPARAVMQAYLEQAGATVGFDRWGRDTTERLRTFAPVDALLLDLMLPNGMTGFEIFAEIRAAPEFANLPIIAVSAMDRDLALSLTRSQGFAGFIAKPVQMRSFARQVAKILSGGQVWGDYE